ncbi:MAG: type II toxin-antitoxin system VapC family toxin [Planctomycetaceae bacterium]|nr:type II toxin-antitoxin system VapC family toxin [Planctomycetaceae bacterium]
MAGIWPLEVANSLLVGERRKRSTQAEAQKWLIYLQSLGINVDGETTARAFNEILNLGRSQNLSAYESASLELAMRKGLPLATLDDKLKAAAAAVGVQLDTVP